MQQKAPVVHLPDPSEWDFRAIDSTRELRFATLYEYSRSSRFSNPLVEWFNSPCRKAIPAMVISHHKDLLIPLGISDFPETVGELIERIHSAHCALDEKIHALRLVSEDTPPLFHEEQLLAIALRFPHFPEPWIKARKRLGVEVVSQRWFEWPRAFPAFVALFDEKDNTVVKDPLYSLRSSARPANIRDHQIEIDWSAPQDEILKGFRDWVAMHHPSKAGNPRLSASLKNLSAYRIFHGSRFTDQQAVDAVSDYKTRHPCPSPVIDLPSYEDGKKWNRAVREAEKLLDGQFGLELSRRFQDQWLT